MKLPDNVPVLPLIAIATVTLLHKIGLLNQEEAKGYLREVLPTILPNEAAGKGSKGDVTVS